MRALALAVMMLTFAIGCAPITDVLGTPETTPKAPYTNPPPTPTLSPIATVAPTGHGRPYTPEMMVAELMDVPYNFPRELQTDFVAAALADQIWTYDGRPYRELNLVGDCYGSPRCDLRVIGLPAFASTRDQSDSHSFSIELPTRVVTRSYSGGLRGYPPELGPEVEALARSLDTAGRYADLPLRRVLWALPPPGDAYLVQFQRGSLEDAIVRCVALDRAQRQILWISEDPC